MRYEKPPLSLQQQADLLLSRGMVGDRSLMVERLGSVNYYRLSGYWFPFRLSNAADSAHPLDGFQPGTSFNTVWNRYAFDRRLRLLVMDAIERVEISVRTGLAYYHSLSHGAFGYAMDSGTLPKLSLDYHQAFLWRIKEETDRSRETFVKHFREKYGSDHEYLPIWMAMEVMSFGSILTFYRGASHRVKQDLASRFGMPSRVFDSWLLSLNFIRNLCAHHGRLWNRELGVKPLIPLQEGYPDWHVPVSVPRGRVFGVLTILKHCLNRTAPQSKWPLRLQALLREFPEIPIDHMGFPVNWTACPIWAGSEGVGHGK